jgi:hypothetical protein
MWFRRWLLAVLALAVAVGAAVMVAGADRRSVLRPAQRPDGSLLVYAPARGAAPAAARKRATRLPPPVACGTCFVPPARTSWQWQLSDRVDTTVHAAVFDVDWEQPASVVARLHAAGRKAFCYIDAGSWEQGRPDAGEFPAAVLGRRYIGYPDERWLDVRRLDVLGPIMKARMTTCKQKRFDGVQFDNLDGWQNPTGFSLTRADDLAFSVWLANTAHRKRLSAAFENALDNVPTLVRYYDWAISEDCALYGECQAARPFTGAGKLFGDAEYKLARAHFCPTARASKISAMTKRRDLGAYRMPC